MDIPKELRDSGLRATLPRLRILQLFQSQAIKHGTAEDVYHLLRAENLQLGLATIYRVLVQFVQAGILVRSSFESNAAIFELNEGHHHDHLVCTRCGKVEEFFDPEIERRQEEIAKARGFDLADHALALYGICMNCTDNTNHQGSREPTHAAEPKAASGTAR
ncbi:MAG TPA: ferric iron uptake transcriptional regulator [Paucimonas sp.]|nr:ferric iron uptake transcriptional regulator [Paucimonas sp.]